jgi:hypothetical protein
MCDVHAAKSDIRKVKPSVAVCPRLVNGDDGGSPEEAASAATITTARWPSSPSTCFSFMA